MTPLSSPKPRKSGPMSGPHDCDKDGPDEAGDSEIGDKAVWAENNIVVCENSLVRFEHKKEEERRQESGRGDVFKPSTHKTYVKCLGCTPAKEILLKNVESHWKKVHKSRLELGEVPKYETTAPNMIK